MQQSDGLKTAFKPMLLCLHLALVTTVLVTSQTAVAATETLRNYNIAAGDLAQALNQFALQSGIAIVAEEKLIRGAKSQGLNGQYSLRQGFEVLLAGTPFRARLGRNGYIIELKDSSGQQVRDKGQLQPIAVIATATSDNDANSVQLPVIVVNATQGQTEGSGSYTTGSMQSSTPLNLSIRDTPQMVKVFSQQYLEDTNIDSFQELINNITGVSLNRTDERIAPIARGFTNSNYLVDGEQYSITDGLDFDLAMFDRVEVVKGANGLMTGTGYPGYAMNYIRKQANSKELKGSLKVSAGSWDSYSSQADIAAGLNKDGSIRGRLVLKHEDSDSFMEGYSTEQNLAYGVLAFDLSKRTSLSLGASINDLNRDGVRWGGLPAYYTDGTRTDFDRSATVSDDWTFWDNQTVNYFAQFKHQFNNDIKLNLNYSYNDNKFDSKLLYFYGQVEKETGAGYGKYYTSIWGYKTTEKNLNFSLSMPFSLLQRNQEIVLGYAYSQLESKDGDYYTSQITESYDLANPTINLYNIDIAEPFFEKTVSQLENTKQTALYFASKLHLLEPLKLIIGARLSNWEAEATSYTSDREFNDELTPYAGIIVDLNPQHSWFVSYTDIFQPQSFRDINGGYLDPLTGESYETGLKGEYFGGRLNAALSVFKIKQDNYAEIITPYTFAAGTTSYAYRAIDGVSSQGLEFEIDGQLSDAWNISFGYAHFNAEDAEGDSVLTTASRTSANLFSSYRWDKLSVGLGANYRSKFYSGDITQKAYTLVNIMAGYQINKNIKAQLNINNLFDKYYYENVGANTMFWGTPRNTTLSLTYKF